MCMLAGGVGGPHHLPVKYEQMKLCRLQVYGLIIEYF